MTLGDAISTIGTFLADVPNLLPLTVLSAFILFFLKELLEGVRRRRSNARKRKAMRRLLKDELERNKWALKSLHNSVNMLEGATHYSASTLSIYQNPIGGHVLRREGEDDFAQMAVPKVHTDFLKGNIQDIALFDAAIFDEALEALDALAEMEHVLKGLLEYAEDQSRIGFEGFPDYAHKELDDSEKVLAALYAKITGKPYEEFRLR